MLAPENQGPILSKEKKNQGPISGQVQWSVDRREKGYGGPRTVLS